MKSTYLLHLVVMSALIHICCEMELVKASEAIHDLAVANSANSDLRLCPKRRQNAIQ